MISLMGGWEGDFFFFLFVCMLFYIYLFISVIVGDYTLAKICFLEKRKKKNNNKNGYITG